MAIRQPPDAFASTDGQVEASVVVLNYNGRHHLEACLNSLAHQTHRAYEVVLVDNGSSDGSAEYVHEAHPWVRLIRLEKNAGFCGGNNVGIRATRGEFVALLNNDTETDPAWLESLCVALRRDPNAGLCASRMIRFWERTVIDNAGDLLTPAGCSIERGRGRTDGPEYGRDCEVFGACAGAALYRRSMLDEIGLLDERLFLTYEDLDLSFRARLAGYRCLYAAQAIVYHKVRATMSASPVQQVFQSQRNIEWVWLKNMPARLMLKYLPHRLLYWAGSAVFFARQGHARTFVRAKAAALAGCGAVLRQRRQIQATRRLSPAGLETLFFKDWIAAKRDKFDSR